MTSPKSSSIVLVIFAALLSLWNDDSSGAEGLTAAAWSIVSPAPEQATGTIAGVVLTADTTSSPVRRAVVSATGGSPAITRSAVTDEQGRFVLTALPAGRFTLSAARPSFVTIAYGATRPGRTGTPLVLGRGQHLNGIRLQLVRGAVVAGVIRDGRGEPLAGIEVSAQRRERTGVIDVRDSAAGTAALTDDDGAYRLYGLAPGDYIISARQSVSGTGELLAPSETEVEAALSELAQTRGAGRGGFAIAPPSARNPSAARTFSAMPIFYPDAVTPEQAVPIALGAGEEHRGVDITLRLLRAVSVEGTVVIPAGQPMTGVTLLMVNETGQAVSGPVLAVRPTIDGHFRYTNVPPGRFTLMASWISNVAMHFNVGQLRYDDVIAAGGMGPCYTAAIEVSTVAGDITGISLPLHTCPSLSGQIVFKGTTDLPPATDVRVNVMRANAFGTFVRRPRLTAISETGTFEWSGGLAPGLYYLTATTADSEPGKGWILQSVIMDGKDLLDEPFALDPGNERSSTAVLTFTDAHTRLSGVLQTASGAAASEYTVVVFPVSQTFWRQPFRRVQAGRPGSDGSFVFHDLPVGDYFIAALTDLEPLEWQDADFLASLVGSAVRVSLTEGEQKRQDLKLAER